MLRTNLGLPRAELLKDALSYVSLILCSARSRRSRKCIGTVVG